jgi:hypothetical protein
MADLAERIEIQTRLLGTPSSVNNSVEASPAKVAKGQEKARHHAWCLATGGSSKAIMEPLAWPEADVLSERSGADLRQLKFVTTNALPLSDWKVVTHSQPLLGGITTRVLEGARDFDDLMNFGIFGGPMIETDQIAAMTAGPSLRIGTVNTDPLKSHRRARTTAQDSREDALSAVRRRLDVSKAVYAQMPPSDVVRYLVDDLGVGQLTTSRAVGVSPTAVRKWRRGEQARPEHRSALASFAAFVSLLTELGLHDPAGWLDIPVSTESTLSPLDLFVSGRPDLVLLQASRLADPHETLDAFDPEWRMTYPIDSEYEVVTLDDGSRSAVPRRS